MINDSDMCIFMKEKMFIGLKQEENKCKWLFHETLPFSIIKINENYKVKLSKSFEYERV